MKSQIQSIQELKVLIIFNQDELYFDENITFIHNYLPLRRFYQIKNPKHEEFPVLMNQEFIFGSIKYLNTSHISI